jgi:HSP20 family protein
MIRDEPGGAGYRRGAEAGPGKEVKTMELKLWSPLFDIDKEWRFDFPGIFHEAEGFRPSVDVVRTDGKLVMTAELPGIEPENVEVTLEGGVLTIKGEKSEETEIEEKNRYIHERSFGAFQRRIGVPDDVTAEDVAADFENGVLKVQINLPEEKTGEPHRIPVGVKAAS